MKKPLDWFPLYIDLWCGSSVKLLSLAAQGAYIALLALQFREGRIPASLKDMAKLIGCDSTELAEIWGELESKFVEVEPGWLGNPVMQEIRQEQESKDAIGTERARNAAAARWSVKNAGNAPGNPPSSSPSDPGSNTQGNAPSNANAMPEGCSEHSSSNADGMPLEKIREDKTREDKQVVNPSDNPSEGGTGGDPPKKPRAWERELFDQLPATHQTAEVKSALTKYGQLRRQKGWGALAPATVEARAKTWATAAPEDVAKALLKSVENGWQAVNVEAKPKPQTNTPNDTKGNVIKLLQGDKAA